MLAESQVLVIKRGFSVSKSVYYNCASQKNKKKTKSLYRIHKKMPKHPKGKYERLQKVQKLHVPSARVPTIYQLLRADTFKEPLRSIKSDLRVLGNALK